MRHDDLSKTQREGLLGRELATRQDNQVRAAATHQSGQSHGATRAGERPDLAHLRQRKDCPLRSDPDVTGKGNLGTCDRRA